MKFGHLMALMFLPFTLVVGFVMARVLKLMMESFWTPASQSGNFFFGAAIGLVNLILFVGVVVVNVLFVEKEGFGAFKTD